MAQPKKVRSACRFRGLSFDVQVEPGLRREGRLAGTLAGGDISQLAIMQLAVGTVGAALAQEAIRVGA